MLDLLKEKGRGDLVGFRGAEPERPERRLSRLLTDSLRKLPAAVRGGRRFQSARDFRVLSSNALIALHIVKTAAVITGQAQFDEYYRQNLYGGDALLKTALDWYGVDDELLRLTAGTAEAARDRRGYLALLAAYNLYTLETNPSVKEAYRTIIAREFAMTRHDDNPLSRTMAAAARLPVDAAPVWRALTLYPDEPVGFGESYWKENGRRVADTLGGGESHGYAREPLPVSHRPRDSFLWQRSARRLRGDANNRYPGTDYLFVYWLGRKSGVITAPATRPTVRSR
jgi:hypothetical protein